MSKLLDAVEEQKAIDAMVRAQDLVALTRADTAALVHELYTRGVSIKDIFGRYYEFDEITSNGALDVEDAELAGYGYDESKMRSGDSVEGSI